MSAQRIAIIGAGNSGMSGFKACREQGFDVVVFEKSDCVGGIWRYRDEELEDSGSIWRKTYLNTSKEMTAFSDFPPPEEYPNFMHNTLMAKYLDSYAEHIGFKDNLKLEHQVLKCMPNDDYETTGNWRLTVENLKDNSTFEDVFNGVMVCVGHNNKPIVPTFKGQHLFNGEVIHSHSYKVPKGYENKRVVVVGIGNSAVDITCDLSTVTDKVYLSTRSGSWIGQRLWFDGLPIDASLLRRYLYTGFWFAPLPIASYLAQIYLNVRFNHKLYGVKPKHGVFSQHVIVSDALPSKIIAGEVVVKNDIEQFTENGIIFKGETKETICDAVIMATGYEISYPFLSEKIIPLTKSDSNLYKFMFYPGLKHPKTLAFISLSLPAGAILPMAELQCRWFALLMANKSKLPDTSEMWKSIRGHKKRINKRYADPVKHALECDWIPTMDWLADKVGVKPNLFKYFFVDPKLWFKLYFGPSLPYQYRLKGPNRWPEARTAIITANSRIKAPFAKIIRS